jgi:hypothetical protein
VHRVLTIGREEWRKLAGGGGGGGVDGRREGGGVRA